MAVDYYVLFPCEVRKQISNENLLRMEKAKARAETVLQILRNNPGEHRNKPESEWSFGMVQLGPNGQKEEVELRVADLLAEAAPLKQLAVYCNSCSANMLRTDFGCGGAIHYPLTRQAEQWLVSRLPDDLNTPCGFLLQQAIQDFKYNGVNIDAARVRDDLYEMKSPAVRYWGRFFSRKIRITSSQILQMMFDVGSFLPAHAKMLAYFLGYIDDEFKPANRMDNSPQPNDDSKTNALKTFCSSIAFAGVNGFEVLVDA
jgi:hypothetical protein